MPEITIESPDDPRLDVYRDLKQGPARGRETFVAEGEKLVLRLLSSPCRTESIVCNAAARDRLSGRVPAETPVYLAETPVISRLIGFRFHRGVLACGRRPTERNVDSLWRDTPASQPCLVVLCLDVRDPENLGTIIRTSAAFGAAGVVVGRAGTEPFSRRVLRTSMGAVLHLPIAQTDDWPAVADALNVDGFATIAAVVDRAATSLRDAPRFRRRALFFGNEADGLPADLVARCRHRVTLPMAASVDSLNVAVAAGIVLHHYAL